MITIEEMEEMEDIISWNLSFNISIEETLKYINKLEYLDLFKFLHNLFAYLKNASFSRLFLFLF